MTESKLAADEISALQEGEVVYSEWLVVTQEQVDGFAASTLDPDPMHIDPDWARTGPFGQTIAFGFLTISLLTHLMHSALKNAPVTDAAAKGYYLNYGFDRLRLVSPVPVGARIRGRFALRSRTLDDKDRHLATFDCTIEIEGQERPALVAEWLSVWVPPAQ